MTLKFFFTGELQGIKFKKGEVKEVPANIAETLIMWGVAEKVEEQG